MNDVIMIHYLIPEFHKELFGIIAPFAQVGPVGPIGPLHVMVGLLIPAVVSQWVAD